MTREERRRRISLLEKSTWHCEDCGEPFLRARVDYYRKRCLPCEAVRVFSGERRGGASAAASKDMNGVPLDLYEAVRLEVELENARAISEEVKRLREADKFNKYKELYPD